MSGVAHRIIAAFDIAVVGGQIERRPAAVVGDVGIGAVIEQIGAQLVVAILGRGQQRGPAVVRSLIDVGAGLDQDSGALEAILASRVNQRRESAAIFSAWAPKNAPARAARLSYLACAFVAPRRHPQTQHRLGDGRWRFSPLPGAAGAFAPSGCGRFAVGAALWPRRQSSNSSAASPGIGQIVARFPRVGFESPALTLAPCSISSFTASGCDLLGWPTSAAWFRAASPSR